MKKLTIFLLSGVLMLGAVACTKEAKTSADAPNSTQDTPQAQKPEDVQQAKNDAKSDTRRNQLNSDIKAHEERNNAANGGNSANRSDDAIGTEVRDKLEANIPASALVVKSDKGVVTVSGTVTQQPQLQKIEPLAKQIKGVTQVNNKATVAAPKAK